MADITMQNLDKIQVPEDLVTAIEDAMAPGDEGIVNEVEAGIIISVASECGVFICSDEEDSLFIDNGQENTAAKEVSVSELVDFCITYLETAERHMNSVNPVYSQNEYLVASYSLCIMQRLKERVDA